MKFGKDLEQYKCEGWEEEYIDYKGLKLILKQLEDAECIKEEVDADFFQALEDELEKVNRVFHSRTTDIERMLDTTSRSENVDLPATGEAAEGNPEVGSDTAKERDAKFYEAYRELGRLQASTRPLYKLGFHVCFMDDRARPHCL